MQKNKKFWVAFGILIVGLVSLIIFLTTPETPSIEKIGSIGLILSYIGLFLSLYFSSEFRRSFVLILFGLIFLSANELYYGHYGPEILFYWIPGGGALFLGCLHAIWTFTKRRRDTN